jgi:hypothetical protein
MDLVMNKLCLCLIAFAVAAAAQAQQQCGYPSSVLKSGFEDGEQPASVTLPPDNTALSITIQGPANNATVGVDAIQIYGTYIGPANTGVSVNGVAALTNGNAFVSPRIPLEPGPNTLTIRYASTDAPVVTQTRTVSYSNAALPSVVFAARSPGDYAPTAVQFVLATVLPAGQTTVARVEVDYNGDGIFETDGAQPTQLAFAYDTPGLYVARARVSFDDGNPATPLVVQEDSARVLIQSLAFTRQTLCGVYYTMKSRLQQNQIALALNTQLPGEQRTDMSALWNALASANNLTPTANKLGEIVTGQLSRNAAELVIAIPTAQPTQYSAHEIRFRRDESGVWRIEFM